MSALDQLQQQAKQATDAAVAEGKRDVEEAKAAGSTYVEQAKQIAANVVGTAQACTFRLRHALLLISEIVYGRDCSELYYLRTGAAAGAGEADQGHHCDRGTAKCGRSKSYRCRLSRARQECCGRCR